MASRDTRQEFEGIVERLTADYPSLARTGLPPWPRPVLITVLAVGAVVRGFLSVAMVAWGRRGVAIDPELREVVQRCGGRHCRQCRNRIGARQRAEGSG